MNVAAAKSSSAPRHVVTNRSVPGTGLKINAPSEAIQART